MESKKYKEFLKHQAVKRPLHRDASAEKIILGISQESRRKTREDDSSDILDSILLGREMSQSVTVDRRAASLLRYRLNMLEEENLHMRKQIRFMKIAIILMVVTVFSLCVYLALCLM